MVYTKCKSKKIHETDSAPHNREVKMELLVKIVNDFKL